MSKKEMTLGKNVCAYTVVELPEETDMSIENLKQIACQVFASGGFNGKDVEFTPEWDTDSSRRIVHVMNDGAQDLSDITLENQDVEADQSFNLWLKGKASLKDAIVATEWPLSLDLSIEEIHEACFSIAGVSLRVSFACRKGATKEEKDLAMLVALENAGASVECVLLGEQPARKKA